jgi:hypothetical protein
MGLKLAGADYTDGSLLDAQADWVVKVGRLLISAALASHSR